jgi:hypothetical protein
MTINAIETLIGEYLTAWNEADAVTRQTILRQIWADEGRYTDPQSDGQGREALDQIIARFHKNSPGSRFSLNGSIDHHHNYVHFAWTLKLPDGSALHGMDFGEVSDDNRLCRIVGFFGRD